MTNKIPLRYNAKRLAMVHPQAHASVKGYVLRSTYCNVRPIVTRLLINLADVHTANQFELTEWLA